MPVTDAMIKWTRTVPEQVFNPRSSAFCSVLKITDTRICYHRWHLPGMFYCHFADNSLYNIRTLEYVYLCVYLLVLVHVEI